MNMKIMSEDHADLIGARIQNFLGHVGAKAVCQ